MLNREIDYQEIPSIFVSGDYDTDDTAIVQEEIDEDDDENDGMDDGELPMRQLPSRLYYYFYFSSDSVFKSSEGQDGIKDISIDCFGRKLQCSVSPVMVGHVWYLQSPRFWRR